MQRYHPILASAATRVSRTWGRGTSDEIDDIIQEIYLRLCEDRKRIFSAFRDPRPEAAFGYLKVTATNIAHDCFRRRSALKRGADRTTSTSEISDLPADSGDEMERRLTLGEIDQALFVHTQKDNGPRDRTVFRLYYRYGLTAQAISDLPGIGLSAKGVEGVLHRLTKIIRETFSPAQGKCIE
jgi:RNA polymerase sigma factor (sigma-70 family)